MGRTIRNKNDYSFVIFADYRYDLVDHSSRLPEWIQQVSFSTQFDVATSSCPPQSLGGDGRDHSAHVL